MPVAVLWGTSNRSWKKDSAVSEAENMDGCVQLIGEEIDSERCVEGWLFYSLTETQKQIFS